MSLTLEPLVKIYVADPTPDKADANKLLTYIHLVSQIDKKAPYSTANPAEVSALVRKEVYGKYDHEFTGTYDESAVEDVVIHYQAAFETPDEASIRTLDNKIYEIKDLVDNTKIEIEKSVARGAVSYSSNFTILNKMMQDLTKIIATRDELKANVMKAGSKGEMKGGKKMSFMAKRKRDLNSVKKTAVAVDEEEEDKEIAEL
jgi:hypothetical protein